MFLSPRLLLALLLPAVSALGQGLLVEAPVTVALTFTQTGAAVTRAAAGDTEWITTRLVDQRLGNRQVLDALVARDLIPSVQGWRIVAVWATWTDDAPYAGNAYRFFARRGAGANAETVAIPSDILSAEPLTATVARRHRIANETTILGGSTETFRVYEQAVVAGPLHTTLTQGIETGTGRYVRPQGETDARYVPKASKLVLQGTFDANDESASGVVAGYLKYGPARFVSDSPYAGKLGAAANLVKTGSGTLTIGGSNTYNGTTDILGGTLTFGDLGAIGSIGSSLTGTSGTFTPGSFTGTVVLTHGGTLTLGTGETLQLAPGESFDFSTLSSEERLGAILTPFTFDPDSGQLTITPPAP